MNDAREWLKLGLAAAFEGSGAGTLLRKLRGLTSGAHIHVLGYHRVVDHIDDDGPVNPSLCITTRSFRRQMEILRDRFVILPLDYAVRAAAGELALRRDAAVVTFDDGYRDVLLRADPILQELEIPATVFVPSGFAGEKGRARMLPHDRLYAAAWAAARAGHDLTGGSVDYVGDRIRATPAAELLRLIEDLEQRFGAPELDDGAEILSPVELRALAEHGWEIGSHTIGHTVLTHESLSEVRRQLETSKAELERWSGKRCRFFAYCNGYHSQEVVAELRRAGYEGAVTTCDRPNRVGRADPFRISRKCLWEGHARDPRGRFSPTLSTAHLHDLFGTLGLTTAQEGAMPHVGAPESLPLRASSNFQHRTDQEVDLGG